MIPYYIWYIYGTTISKMKKLYVKSENYDTVDYDNITRNNGTMYRGVKSKRTNTGLVIVIFENVLFASGIRGALFRIPRTWTDDTVKVTTIYRFSLC